MRKPEEVQHWSAFWNEPHEGFFWTCLKCQRLQIMGYMWGDVRDEFAVFDYYVRRMFSNVEEEQVGTVPPESYGYGAGGNPYGCL